MARDLQAGMGAFNFKTGYMVALASRGSIPSRVRCGSSNSPRRERVFPALKRGGGHNSLEIRRGVRAKLTVVGRGALLYISLCEARLCSPPSFLIIIA